VEIVAAEHEGVKFAFLAAPTRVIGDENGKVKQFEYLKMELGEPDASGRRRPVPIEGTETLLDCDMLITAIGQGPDMSFMENEKLLSDLELTRWNTIDSADPVALQSNIPYIFTAGDSATGAALVVDAIGGGRRAAGSIHQYLTGEEIKPPENNIFKKHIEESLFDSVEGVGHTPRTPMPELPVKERIKTFEEADLVVGEADAKTESNRCLACCRICYNPDRDAA
jgi:NADPH-dependent glutamate synthase beta subunit-like oxidoreductase